MKVRRFRISGVLPNGDTAYVTADMAEDAPEQVQYVFQNMVREAFAEKYPDAIHLRERAWTEEVPES